MRLLDRYLLRELLIPFGYCLAGFFIFWISFDLLADLDEFQKLKLRALDVAEYYAIKTPELLVTVLPIAFLLALLYALTNHARHQELSAIRAAGVGLWRLAAPYLAMGLFLSLSLFALSEWWVPDSTAAAEQVLQRYVHRDSGPVSKHWETRLGFRNTRDNRTWVLAAFNRLTYEIVHPHILWTLPDGSRRDITADRGAWTEQGWIFTNVEELVYPPPGAPLSEQSLQTNLVLMSELTETPEEILSEIKVSKIKSFKEAKKAQLSIREILNYKRLHTEASDKFPMLDTKLQGRLAAPWTCLVVVLIALPFGAASGRRDLFVGVASSIVICFAYFVVLQLALAFGTRGTIPGWLAAWAPNAFFALAGIALTSRIR
jgi:lipopolysaccharide export system permease protein